MLRECFLDNVSRKFGAACGECVIGRVTAALPALCRRQTGKELVRKCVNMGSRDGDRVEDKTDQPIRDGSRHLPPLCCRSGRIHFLLRTIPSLRVWHGLGDKDGVAWVNVAGDSS